MARKSSTQMFEEAQKGMRPGRASRFNEKKFINFELDVQLQKRCKEWAVGDTQLWEAMGVWNGDGYKATFKWDGYSKSFAVFVSTDDETSPNFGYILTGRGSTPAKAWKQAIFKHQICFDGNPWSGYAERPDSAEMDD